MKTTLIYLAGFATPIALFIAFNVAVEITDWKNARRYKRAWAKFCADYERLTPEELAECRKKWEADPLRFSRYSDDRDRYFALRWQHGLCTDA